MVYRHFCFIGKGLGKGFVLIHPFTSEFSQLPKLWFIASIDEREGV